MGAKLSRKSKVSEAAASTPDSMESDHFCCDVCSSMLPLHPGCMAELDCNCCICVSCADSKIKRHMKLQKVCQDVRPGPVGEVFAIGQEVLYNNRTKNLVAAVVVEVDRSVHPPQYGIRLLGSAATDIRFTEQSRLLPGHVIVRQGLPSIPCPNCAKVVERPVLARLFPDTLHALEDALTTAWLEARGIIRCPSCQALIEKVEARGTADTVCRCDHGSGSSKCRCGHRHQHRFRCGAPQCGGTFCDSCWTVPYHEGLDCVEARAPCCPLCGTRVLSAANMQAARLSTKRLREEATALGMDCTWCLERSELLEVFTRAKQTCEGCRPRLQQMCSKQLPCKHWCCGPRNGRDQCMPCLHEGCHAQAHAVGDGLCCCCFEPLVSAAVVTLGCAAGHMVHLDCAKRRLQVGCPGPALTFDYLFCPLCGPGSDGRRGNLQVMTAQPDLQHELLREPLQKALKLRDEVVRLAKQRVRLLHANKEDVEMLTPGGRFDGRPIDYALSKFQFFACSRCKQPYFGGLRACGAPDVPDAAPAAYDASELVCGSCAAVGTGQNCQEHGVSHIEWKCRFCCQVASWFCWGSHHMCDRCHSHPGPQRPRHACPGPGRCVLRVPHPPPGTEFCLGCGVCRTKEQPV